MTQTNSDILTKFADASRLYREAHNAILTAVGPIFLRIRTTPYHHIDEVTTWGTGLTIKAYDRDGDTVEYDLSPEDLEADDVAQAYLDRQAALKAAQDAVIAKQAEERRLADAKRLIAGMSVEDRAALAAELLK